MSILPCEPEQTEAVSKCGDTSQARGIADDTTTDAAPALFCHDPPFASLFLFIRRTACLRYISSLRCCGVILAQYCLGPSCFLRRFLRLGETVAGSEPLRTPRADSMLVISVRSLLISARMMLAMLVLNVPPWLRVTAGGGPRPPQSTTGAAGTS